MSVGAWITPAMHKQPGRLVRAALRSPFGPSADRLTTLEGLGRLGFWPFDDDEELGTDEEVAVEDVMATDEEKEAESDTDWVALVTGIAKAASPVAVEVAKGAFMQSKLSQGWTGDMISKYLGLGQQRAAAVQAGTAPLPTSTWVGIGIAAVGVIGLVVVLMMSRRR